MLERESVKKKSCYKLVVKRENHLDKILWEIRTREKKKKKKIDHFMKARRKEITPSYKGSRLHQPNIVDSMALQHHLTLVSLYIEVRLVGHFTFCFTVLYYYTWLIGAVTNQEPRKTIGYCFENNRLYCFPNPRWPPQISANQEVN